ncbi:MAG: hypothetical protein AAFR17_12495 [Pseudomonadota bacterium]
MHRPSVYRLLPLLFAFWVTATPASADQAPAAPSQAALTFVAGFSDAHLANMLSRFGQRSPVLASFAQVDAQLTANTLDAAIGEAVAQHGPVWQRNLASAWMPLLSEEELVSLTNSGAQSPHIDKYLDLRNEAGVAMQASSQELFAEILRNVIDRSVASLSPTGGWE